MPSFSQEDLILIKQLRTEKHYAARKISTFPNKSWTHFGVEKMLYVKLIELDVLRELKGLRRKREVCTDENIAAVQENGFNVRKEIPR